MIEEAEFGIDIADKDGPKMFVAGSHFYNYEMYGGLRPGGKISLFSRQYFGLAFSAFASAFVYVGVRYGVVPQLGAQFQFQSHQQQAVDRLMELPATFCFLVGLVSDSYPLFGHHRKSYMVIGNLLSFLMLMAIAIISFVEPSLHHHIGPDNCFYLMIALLSIVSFGSMINFTSAHTMVIMLSQQETLGERGMTQANYLMIRISAQCIAQLFTYVIGTAKPSVQLPLTLMLVLGISVAAIPMIVYYLHEAQSMAKKSVKESWDACFKLTQQKAVWRIICFISCCAFFMYYRSVSGQDALRRYAKVTPMGSLLSYVMHDFVMLVTIWVWRTFFMNTLWKRVFAVAPVVAILSQALISVLIVFNVARAQSVYVLGQALLGIAHGILQLTTLVPVTEIVQEGMEGGTVGLALSFEKLFKIFVNTFLSSVKSDIAMFSLNDLVADTSHVRWMVITALSISWAVNAVTFVGLPFLPLQKLDAQQLRTFGGFAKGAGVASAIVFVLLFLYCAVLNLLSVHEKTACLRFVGGNGC